MPPRQYGSGPRIPRGPPGPRRDFRRDDRRRTMDEEDTVLDTQEISSVDRGKLNSTLSVYLKAFYCN